MVTERQLRVALQDYERAVARTPIPFSFLALHELYRELNNNYFHIPTKPWANPFELAALANRVAMFGSGKPKRQSEFKPALAFNPLKELWRLSEELSPFSEDPDYVATFALRFIYQQLPFIIHSSRVTRIMSRMKSILDDSAMASYVMRKLPDNGRMWEAINWLYQEFRSRPFISNSELRSSLNGTASLAMQLLGADRAKRLDFYKNRLELDDPAEKVYEINSLLRYPIIQRRDGIWCPFPQLIAYASSRGLYLHLSEEDKNDFCSPFSVAFEAQVYNWVRRALPEADVLTESEERSLGWHGKTNDVSVISGDAALLIECKVSCLYAEAKRTAAPQAIVRDVRKQIADSQGRRGLYQLHEKIKAIRARTIPVALADRFQNVKRIFPVLLIWDDVAFANTPEVLGNIVRDELMSHDVRDFEYQIWQAEHFDWLVEYAGKELIEWVAEKFSSSNRAIDLNSYLVERTANNSLKEVLFAPAGDSRAFRTLRHLIETQGAVPRVGQI